MRVILAEMLLNCGFQIKPGRDMELYLKTIYECIVKSKVNISSYEANRKSVRY